MNKKILGIDFGTKTIGLAIACFGIVMPYKNIVNSNNTINEIKQICEDEQIEIIVLGLPMNASSTESQRTLLVKNFYELLKNEIQIKIELEDERYSTKQAEEQLKKSNFKASQIKKIKDMNSAIIIINNYLGRHQCK